MVLQGKYMGKWMDGYLEADDVGRYEHPDALDQISQSVDEGRSDSQAALLPLPHRPPRL